MCMADYCDEWAKVSEVNVRTARKRHLCLECGRDIQPGEQYENARLLFDDLGWSTLKTCAHCMAARTFLSKVCGNWVYECVHEDLREHFDEHEGYNQLFLGRAVVGMRRRWQRFDGEGLMPVLQEPASFYAAQPEQGENG